ncbi:amidase [Kitasatospora camelliae]|uniref:Amidase n=1 Tax=Kitasatospora camelliae TaxID=3156397 RepID=A0AAU8JY74_9ACTN
MEPMIPLLREAADLRTGHLEPEAHADLLCTRIDRIDPVIRAFVPEHGRYERLTAEARALAARHRHGPPDGLPVLYGVPVGIKDVIHVDGLPTHAGSSLPPGVLAGPEAPLVTRLRAAGALVAGKTATAEFAGSAPGPTRNPHDLAHTPGGSSSGSAAAVAAGLLPLAVGTQTMGSIVRPAAYCGVVGFRPGYGRIPTAGVIAHSPSLDTVGLFTADTAGAALAAGVLCDGWEHRPPPGRDPVVGVPVGPYLERTRPDAREEFLRRLATLGLTVRHVDLLPDLDDLHRHLQVIDRYELAQVHADLFARFATLYRPETAAAIRRGHEIDRADHTAALQARAGFQRRLAEATAEAGVDLWITPAAPGPAPRGLDSTGDAVMSKPWSYAGLPAVSLPAGRLDGLPIGLQLVGSAGADEDLLGFAALIEQRLAA